VGRLQGARDHVRRVGAVRPQRGVRAYRGRGAARCDLEGANVLALNLAHEIATGKRGVQDARTAYGEQITAMKAGRPAPYTERLVFTPPTNAGDPDQPLTRTGAAGSGR
jgi:hypothetical protein